MKMHIYTSTSRSPARLLNWLLIAALAALSHSAAFARETAGKVASDTTSKAAVAARSDGLIELPALRAAGLSAREAARALRRAGPMNAGAAVHALRAAGYEPRDIERAIAEHYRLDRRQSGRVVASAMRQRPQVAIGTGLARGTEVSICVRPNGELVQCAAGSPPTGGTPYSGRAAPGVAPSRSAPEPEPSSPGLRDWMVEDASSHHWHNSYMLALITYFIYSDALGSPATSKDEFRSLMQSWGMEDVHFVEAQNAHLRAAVVSGDGLVVVVFRGSEMQSTAHCVLKMMFPGVCANLPANWVTNLSFAPMRQRPEWGPALHLRTHAGFDTAVDQLFSDVIGRVEAELMPSRRLFVTGHSLGGAMATLFAYRAQALEQVAVQGVYTYGAPRLMNVPFAAQYQSLLGARTHRWQNRADPVPALPPGQPIGENPIPPLPTLVARETYRHAGRLNYMPNGGATDLNRSSEPLDLPGSVSELMVGDHMMARSPGSYVDRIYGRLSAASKGLLPPPPQ